MGKSPAPHNPHITQETDIAQRECVLSTSKQADSLSISLAQPKPLHCFATHTLRHPQIINPLLGALAKVFPLGTMQTIQFPLHRRPGLTRPSPSSLGRPSELHWRLLNDLS
ncbi:hypothetical protein MJO28_011610 [Puccinia striiformis f. sp. tritici]|uniref:Uncharacterized protein n=1 Tax=Puccinia striiformis f. sp. tritici TaxID=168172 RepID=A0ACC0E382_9BASI|nr:hypothetical protein MJO28_011610 [Puccinia striiformis f. sp. tritici]KAI7946849.1 hypothetical protein MJO29_011376 [Puccinia striiformis f. sp. tritici]